MKMSNCAWLVALALSVFLLTVSPAKGTGLRFDRSVSSHTTLAVADSLAPPHGGALLAADGPGIPKALPLDGPGIPKSLPLDGPGIPKSLTLDGPGIPKSL